MLIAQLFLLQQRARETGGTIAVADLLGFYLFVYDLALNICERIWRADGSNREFQSVHSWESTNSDVCS